MFHWAILLTLALGVTSAFEQEVRPHCGQDETVCEFEWEVTKRETMIQYDTVTGRTRPVYRDLSTGNDVFVARDAGDGCNQTSPLSDEELEKIATADGRYKTTYFINGQFPGPNLVVFEGQQVAVRLTNGLLEEGVSIHWHGMHQVRTPWMDGVAGITQCPINPSETFTYRFLAKPAGTFWYHSHLGVQRTDGLFGAMVVLPLPGGAGQSRLAPQAYHCPTRSTTQTTETLSSSRLSTRTATPTSQSTSTTPATASSNTPSTPSSSTAQTPSTDSSPSTTDRPSTGSASTTGPSSTGPTHTGSSPTAATSTGSSSSDITSGGALTSSRTTPSTEEPLSTGQTSPRPTAPPAFDKEYLFVVQDWYGRESSKVNDMNYRQLLRYWAGYDDLDSCYNATLGLDQTLVGPVPFETALINGKGTTRSPEDLLANADGTTPNMERFRVRRGGTYRFRVINPSLNYAFLINFGGHQLHVISLDGMDIEEIEADAVIAYPAERLDFYLVADQIPAAYVISAVTLEQPPSPGAFSEVVAALWYEEDTEFNLTRVNEACFEEPPCVFVNCPFEQYPFLDPVVECRNIANVNGSDPYKLGPESANTVEEHFLNFHFSEGRSSINGIQFTLPDKPPQLFGEVDTPFRCDPRECSENHCKCTHQIDLKLNNLVQMVFVNTGRMVHPIHLHGHHFYVTKVGYPNVDPLTRVKVSLNSNVTCNGPRCEWTNPEWSGGNVPGMNLENPPLKDTVIVPVGGYVVIRFKADNPGWWALHCHLELHQAEGMMLVMREGLPRDQNPPPRDFPTCGSFDWSEQQFWEKIHGSGGNDTTSQSPDLSSTASELTSGSSSPGGGTTPGQDVHAIWEEYKTLIIVGSVITFLLLVIIVIMCIYCCKLRSAHHGYERI